MARSTVHYADNKTNNILKALHNKLRPAGTPVQRVEYIIELLLLRIFEVKLKQDKEFEPLRKLFDGDNYHLLFSYLLSLNGDKASVELNQKVFPFYGNILGKAREVYKNKNLPQKVQDQLVLIEEVFSNSSFSNNVKNGNLNEVLGLVSDIDEARLLKTDLLGDAIESALSEQGGTKDVGLFRTPDHIRQMMVIMVDPDFKDIIFDPACGTGGFLFDAFQYVMEKVGKDENWPSEKSHKEIREYIKKHIKNDETEMPSSNIANTFYRVGISGIEYLGMIRKMAAINLYIRGLNPANIEQGDSLDLFDPGVDMETKSIVIANPPFGAKLDQPAYPNVWEEYPKTDSTTLFVKLMFNHLRNGGKCAVVVSEGFLTWDSEPAKEMRKIILEEANLKAIISLPQGVFVSKNGQGAKTSVLYFEKGEPTKNIWFYKITNDGYSMGVNRKEVVGCQVPEILGMFTKYVKHGKVPPKTKNSFVIPSDWIKQIDPRLKDRIINETTAQQKEKFSEKRKKEIEKLDGKLKKGDITKKEHEEKCWQFDNVVENSIQNEIAKLIEKAHSYSFNLQNYRSNLSDDQIKKWKDAFGGIKIKNGSNIDTRYQELLKVDSKTALQILASFNTESALEMDIAREYLSKLEKKDKSMRELEEILKEAQKYPLESLSILLKEKSEKVKKENDKEYKQVTIKLYGKGVLLRQKITGDEIKTDGQYVVSAGDYIMSKIDARNGAFGIVPENLDGAIVTSSFPYFEINTDLIDPKYLNAIITQPKFYNQINDMVSGATGRRSVEIEDFLELKIPLPPIESQREIVQKIEKQKTLVGGAESILSSWAIDFPENNFNKELLEKITDKITKGTTPPTEGNKYLDSGVTYIRSENVLSNEIDLTDGVFISKALNDNELKRSKILKNDVLLNIVGASIGRSAVYNFENEANCNQAVCIIRPNVNKLLPKYLSYYLNSNEIQNTLCSAKYGGARDNINLEQVSKLEIPLPSIEIQEQILVRLDKEIESLEKVNKLKKQAEERINKILDEVWSE